MIRDHTTSGQLLPAAAARSVWQRTTGETRRIGLKCPRVRVGRVLQAPQDPWGQMVPFSLWVMPESMHGRRGEGDCPNRGPNTQDQVAVVIPQAQEPASDGGTNHACRCEAHQASRQQEGLCWHAPHAREEPYTARSAASTQRELPTVPAESPQRPGLSRMAAPPRREAAAPWMQRPKPARGPREVSREDVSALADPTIQDVTTFLALR